MHSLIPISECHLLRIPAEIRLQIYRYLVLPYSKIWLQDINKIAGSANYWFDEADSDIESVNLDHLSIPPFGNPAGTPAGNLAGKSYAHSIYSDLTSPEEAGARRVHLAIFRANRQIYGEVASLFYNEVELLVSAENIFSLSPNLYSLEFGAPSHFQPWRYDPLEGLGKVCDNGTVVYDTPPLGGLMEPHVFARFQNVALDAVFDYEHTQNVEMWIHDELNTCIVNLHDAAEYKKMLRASSFVKDFVRLMSNSRRIANLTFCLKVEVMANSTLSMEASYDGDDEDGEEDALHAQQMAHFAEKADERATELFVDSSILDPLLALSNVKNFKFEFAFDELREEGHFYTPLPHQVAQIAHMKTAIEANYKEPAQQL